MNNLFFLLFISIFTFSCTDDDGAEPIIQNAPVNPDSAKLLQLVNTARLKSQLCGEVAYAPVASLSWNNTLELVAQKHADDMDGAKRLSHRGTDGSFLDERLEREGYMAVFWAENLAEGAPSEESVIGLWMDSPGHCENIMNADALEIGVATAGPYWVMILAAE